MEALLALIASNTGLAQYDLRRADRRAWAMSAYDLVC